MIFELMGWTDGRMNIPKSKRNFWKEKYHFPKILNDADFISITRDLYFNLLQLDEDDNNYIIRTLERDTEFLALHNITHYALKLTVERLDSM